MSKESFMGSMDTLYQWFGLPGLVNSVGCFFEADLKLKCGVSGTIISMDQTPIPDQAKSNRRAKDEISPGGLKGILRNASRFPINAAPGGCHHPKIDPVKITD